MDNKKNKVDNDLIVLYCCLLKKGYKTANIIMNRTGRQFCILLTAPHGHSPLQQGIFLIPKGEQKEREFIIKVTKERFKRLTTFSG